jgi:hypothetical protein
MEVIMDSKEQALEKALEYVRKNMDKSISVQEKDNQYIVFDKTGYRVATYQFAPPREAPARGTIVEVWGANEPDVNDLARSAGEFVGDSLLCADGSAWPNWRVVGEQGEMVDMFRICDGCAVYQDLLQPASKCHLCKTTTPTNYKAAK